MSRLQYTLSNPDFKVIHKNKLYEPKDIFAIRRRATVLYLVIFFDDEKYEIVFTKPFIFCYINVYGHELLLHMRLCEENCVVIQ